MGVLGPLLRNVFVQNVRAAWVGGFRTILHFPRARLKMC